MQKMIAEYMEKGFLDNIVDMFKHDKSLYSMIGDLLGDERSRVRIGAVALVEALKDQDGQHIVSAIPSIARRLKDSNATIRGDAAYLLGLIGDQAAIPFLEDITGDVHPLVREIAAEAISEIRKGK